jgi:hypothetical protein
VREHVREQFALFGPKSDHREYFGYRLEGKLASAVVRGKDCRSTDRCVVNIAGAARAIPRGARLLGEWHTHPSIGSHMLSTDDVRSVRQFRRIPCYQAFYSTPRGDIYAWDVKQTSVPAAMATRSHLGNLADVELPPLESKPRIDTRGRLASYTARHEAISPPNHLTE